MIVILFMVFYYILKRRSLFVGGRVCLRLRLSLYNLRVVRQKDVVSVAIDGQDTLSIVIYFYVVSE